MPGRVALIDDVVAPFVHRYAIPAEAVKVALPPEQIDMGPEGEITGVLASTIVILNAVVVA